MSKYEIAAEEVLQLVSKIDALYSSAVNDGDEEAAKVLVCVKNICLMSYKELLNKADQNASDILKYRV